FYVERHELVRAQRYINPIVVECGRKRRRCAERGAPFHFDGKRDGSIQCAHEKQCDKKPDAHTRYWGAWKQHPVIIACNQSASARRASTFALGVMADKPARW